MTQNTKPLIDEAKEYLKVELDLLKLNLLEKTARLLSFIIGMIFASVMSLIAVAYFSVMLYDMLNQFTDSAFWTTIIMIVLFIALSALIFIFSEKLFLNFFIKRVYRVFSKQSIDIETEKQKYQHQDNDPQNPPQV